MYKLFIQIKKNARFPFALEIGIPGAWYLLSCLWIFILKFTAYIPFEFFLFYSSVQSQFAVALFGSNTLFFLIVNSHSSSYLPLTPALSIRIQARMSCHSALTEVKTGSSHCFGGWVAYDQHSGFWFSVLGLLAVFCSERWTLSSSVLEDSNFHEGPNSIGTFKTLHLLILSLWRLYFYVGDWGRYIQSIV